jgi:hypothetical protein
MERHGDCTNQSLQLHEEARMKAATLIGILLIILGVGALAYQGISYREEEKVLDVGPIEATKETTKTVPIPPILGVVAVIGGVALVAATARGGSTSIT